MAVALERGNSAALLAARRFTGLSRDDHHLLQELTLGVLRRQGWLDFLIERYGRRPVKSLDIEVLLALRLGLYQLRALTRIPAHAAINESVNLVRVFRKRSAAPFVNAILRASQREGEPPVSCLPADPVKRLSVVTSHPEWLLREWIERRGLDEASAHAISNNLTPPQVFRRNERIIDEESLDRWLAENGVITHRGRLVPEARIVERGSISPQSLPVREGWIYLQEESSQMVARLAIPQPDDEPGGAFWDVCAAPGGKSAVADSLLPKDWLHVATDNNWSRLLSMQSIFRRLRLDRVRTALVDLSSGAPFAREAFRYILVDAPCTGLGTIRKNPEIKWRVGPADVARLSAIQSTILTKAAEYLSPGGVLTYSVCSTTMAEGEEVIERFRHEHPEFRDVTRERLVEIGVDPDPLLTATHGARTFPHHQESEGFFFCVLWKRRAGTPA